MKDLFYFSYLSIFNRKFSIKTLRKDPNIFGDLSYNKYERIKMDKMEEKEEKFSENIVSKRKKLYDNDYYKLIKSHVINKNLQLALSVLDLIKENNDKPNIHIYRLLMSVFAQQGDIEQCFKLFKQIKERNLIFTPHIFTSLINACAESSDKKKALKYLTILREYFYEKKINLNDIHYSSLIKAYSWHKQISIAFEIADEAKDNGIYSKDIISALFHAIINDTENGLKYALCLWHKMKIIKMKPNIFHYNLFLKAIKNTNFGDLKINDILVPNSKNTQIQFMDTGKSDLLDSPPVLTNSLIIMLKKHNYFLNKENLKREIKNKNMLLSRNLNNILKENRFLLFGGIDKFLKRMKNDNVTPNIKTLTLILDLLPFTIEAEEYFLKYITSNNFKTDLTFFNVLIKRRCIRKQYNAAKDVLNEIQSRHFIPNIITFGVLAIGCIRCRDGIELLEQMSTIGYIPNYKILETLFLNACRYNNYVYIYHLMEYILHNNITPSEKILNILEKFDELVLGMLENEDKYNRARINEIRKDYNDFKIKYENWKEKIQNDVNLLK